MNDFDEFIRATRQEFEPSSEERARVRRRLLARAGGVGLVASVATKAGATYGSSALGGQSLAGLAKLFVASMAVTFAGGGAVVAVTRVLSSPSPASQGAAAASTAAVSRGPVAPPRPRVTGSASVEPAATVPVAPPREPPRAAAVPANPPSAVTLEAELALLRAARLAFRNGKPEQSRRLLDVLDQRHPEGALLEERSALRAVTDCEAGREARNARAAEFLRRYPSSVYVAKVRRVCRSESNTGPTTPIPAASFTGSDGAGH